MSETKYTDAERPIWVPYWPNTLGRLWQAVIAIVAVVAIAIYRGRLEVHGSDNGHTIGSIALLALMACVWIGLNDNVIRWGIPVRFVRRVEDHALGSGVSIPPRIAKLWLITVASISVGTPMGHRTAKVKSLPI